MYQRCRLQLMQRSSAQASMEGWKPLPVQLLQPQLGTMQLVAACLELLWLFCLFLVQRTEADPKSPGSMRESIPCIVPWEISSEDEVASPVGPVLWNVFDGTNEPQNCFHCFLRGNAQFDLEDLASFEVEGRKNQAVCRSR